MAAGTGIAAQVGVALETTWGTEVTTGATFIPLVSESVQRNEDHTISNAIRAGRFVLGSEQWNGGVVAVGGGLEFELDNKNVRTLFKCMFGTESTNSPYTYSPADLTGDSFTLQIGKPSSSGTVHPFTYAGTKVNTWEISATVGEMVKLSLDVIAKSETTSTALMTASYTSSSLPFKFTGATLTIAGSAVNTVRDMSIKGDNKLARRQFLGTQSTAEPFPSDMYEYTGKVTTDFESLTAYNRFVTGTEAALVMTFTRGSSTIVITCNVKFDGMTPNVAGRDILAQELPFMCIGSTTDASAITAVYTP